MKTIPKILHKDAVGENTPESKSSESMFSFKKVTEMIPNKQMLKPTDTQTRRWAEASSAGRRRSQCVEQPATASC